MIRLYHKTKRNHRQALQAEAYMVDDKGFTKLPESEQGANHALYLVEHCGFMFPKGEGPHWLDEGPEVPEEEWEKEPEPEPYVEPEPPNDPPTEEGDPDVPPPVSDTPTVSADEVKAAFDAGATFEPIEEPEAEPKVPETAKDAPEPTEASLDQSREELRTMAASLGLEGYKAMSKVELVEVINTTKAGQGEDR